MGTHLLFLKQVYDDLLMDAPSAKESHECAALLTPHFSSEDLSTKPTESHRIPPKSDAHTSSALDSAVFCINDELEAFKHESHLEHHAKEIILLQLTLIKMMLLKVKSQELAAGIKQKYIDIIRILLKDTSVDAKLIYLLCSSDKLLSHMASKSLVSLIHFQLTEEGSLNSAWLAFSSETLLGFPSSRWLAQCLWSLTDLIRETLKDKGLCEKGDLEVVLGPLDNILEGIYNSAASYYSDLPQDIAISPKVTNDLSSFLDLLEMLVASRIQVPLNCSCQRMMFLNASCVLDLSTAPLHYLIKKKSITLLKTCILQKAGEDFIKKKMPSSSHQDPHFEPDRLALAGAVLQLVNSGWLNKLSVGENASHFGGSQVKPEVDLCHRSDQVTLRALSLILLKALEIKIQDSSSEVDIQVQLESVMGPLLRFLGKHLRFPLCVHLFEHPCVWVSMLFIEQDDDLLEAAKALLTIHLKLERFRHGVGVVLCHSDNKDALMHRNGCNPHCIFLFLLKSIAFDATVLLDFLISFETCFLEYFVRYLKLLVEDWHQIVEISKYLEPGSSGNDCQLDSNAKNILSDPQSAIMWISSSSQKLSSPQNIDHRMIKPNRSNFWPVSDSPSLPGSLQRLVDYESSDDSEPECFGEERSTSTNPMSLDIPPCSYESPLVEMVGQATTKVQERLNISSPSHHKTYPDNSGSAEGMLRKSVLCFKELQRLISRLHGRNLFPYNPVQWPIKTLFRSYFGTVGTSNTENNPAIFHQGGIKRPCNTRGLPIVRNPEWQLFVGRVPEEFGSVNKWRCFTTVREDSQCVNISSNSSNSSFGGKRLRMKHILTTVNSWFWWENIWMPANCSWANFEDHNGYVFPKPQQLFVTIPYAFVMLAIRFFVERCFAIPLANILGIKNMKRVKPQPNPTLETFFKECTKKPSQSEIRGLAKKCNWTVHLVEKWFRRRRNLEIPTLHKKFREACWRFLFYTTSFTAGIIFLYDKPWFHDIWHVWVNYPFQSVLPSQYWYYMLEMSFYWSLLLTLGIDTKRKDFKAHVVHHLAALALMFSSWSGNYIRIGTLVMVVHDSADILLEAAKMFNYARWENTCSVLFVSFSIVFFITRIIIFPFWILRATMFYPLYYTQTIVLAYFFFNGQLLILQALHIYWGYLVFNILKKFIFIKHVKDDRSDEEEEDSFSDAEEAYMKNGSKNGSSHALLNNGH